MSNPHVSSGASLNVSLRNSTTDRYTESIYLNPPARMYLVRQKTANL